ncbi:MAG: trypsin-like peptidase domain-containing protein [Bacteroidota bacterium]
MKTNWIYFLLMGLLACGRSVEERSHTVVNIVNGNTIQLKNGLMVQLIGTEETPEAYDYLKKTVLNEKIRFILDRSNKQPVTHANQRVHAYITTNRGISINGELLKKHLSPLNLQYLTDSLTAFRSYAEEDFEATVETKKPTRKSRKETAIEETPHQEIPKEAIQLPEKPYQPLEGKSLRELVKLAEPCVFLVMALDASNHVIATGTGFFLNGEGLAVSNYHVFQGAKRWAIKTKAGKTFPVTTVIDSNEETDYLTFKVDIPQSPYLKLSEALPEKGEDIFVLGNPKGLESTVTRGVVSAFRNRNQENDFIQIDAAISSGSSGSPVMNMQGEVVGIATAKLTECENCNFAVNIQLIKAAL